MNLLSPFFEVWSDLEDTRTLKVQLFFMIIGIGEVAHCNAQQGRFLLIPFPLRLMQELV